MKYLTKRIFFITCTFLIIFSGSGIAIIADRIGTKGFSLACTGSMYPVLTCTNNVTMEFVGYSRNFSVGDIVAYSLTVYQRLEARKYGLGTGYEYLIHRIVRIENGNYILKGDNNLEEDNLVLGTIHRYQIRYKVVSIR